MCQPLRFDKSSHKKKGHPWIKQFEPIWLHTVLFVLFVRLFVCWLIGVGGGADAVLMTCVCPYVEAYATNYGASCLTADPGPNVQGPKTDSGSVSSHARQEDNVSRPFVDVCDVRICWLVT